LSGSATVNPSTVQLPEQPARLIEELGAALDGFKCNSCDFITISDDAIRKHCKKEHQQVWSDAKAGGFSTVKVQTLFGTSGRQKYFIVDIDEAESGENLDPDQVVTQQLSTWRLCHFIIRSKLCALVSMHESDVTACTRAR
jgi:hypothetical protein